MKYRLSPDFIVRNIVDECLLVPIRATKKSRNEFYALNPTGKIVIDSVSSGKDVDSMIKEICENYDVDEKTAQADIYEFISAFKDMGVLIEAE